MWITPCWTSRAAERRALQETFAQFRLGPCPEDRVERYAALNASYWRRLERGEITKAQLLPGRFQEFFQREGIACTDYDQVNAAYQCHLGDTVVFLDQSYDLVRDPAGPGQAVRGYQRHPHSPGAEAGPLRPGGPL